MSGIALTSGGFVPGAWTDKELFALRWALIRAGILQPTRKTADGDVYEFGRGRSIYVPNNWPDWAALRKDGTKLSLHSRQDVPALLAEIMSLHAQVLELKAALLQKGDWIPWGGGEQPVPDGTLVDLEYRKGYLAKQELADEHDWTHDESEYDIVAYRVLP